jgi:outer membrane protein TolC
MIADTRYLRGLGNQVESLAAAIDLLTQQRAAIDLQNEQVRAQLVLIKALGGGSNTAAMARDEMKTR